MLASRRTVFACAARPLPAFQDNLGPAATGSNTLRSSIRRSAFSETVRQVEGFTDHGGTWAVKGNELWAGAGPGPKLISDSPIFGVGEVGVEILLPDDRDGNAALIARVREAGVGADRFIGYEIALDARNQVLRLGRHRHNFELIRDVPCQVPTGRWISLLAKFDKASLEVLVDGNPVVRHDDGTNTLPAGAVGLRPWQRDARYRNLWVKTNGQHHELPFRQDTSIEHAHELLSNARIPPVAFFTRHALGRPNTISCAIWQSQPTARDAEFTSLIRLVQTSPPGRFSATRMAASSI